MADLTHLIEAAQEGDGHAAAKLLPIVDDELRKLAAAQMAHEKPGQTLNATALVHEAYLRLVGSDKGKSWDNRGHFFVAAATAMRRILVERARRKKRHRHGGGRQRIELFSDLAKAPEPDDELLALDGALAKLTERHPDKARLVELRYFAGLSGDQAAKVMGISSSTADRHWVYARAWLQRELRGEGCIQEK